MKKRFLLPLITICTIISITIGIASFSYAWLSQVPSYEFILSTGDYMGNKDALDSIFEDVNEWDN